MLPCSVHSFLSGLLVGVESRSNTDVVSKAVNPLGHAVMDAIMMSTPTDVPQPSAGPEPLRKSATLRHFSTVVCTCSVLL